MWVACVEVYCYSGNRLISPKGSLEQGGGVVVMMGLEGRHGGQSGVSSNVPSSLVPLAIVCGWTVGPGALGWRPGGERAEGALVGVEVGGVRCGYWRRPAPAAVLAALEDAEPIFVGVWLGVCGFCLVVFEIEGLGCGLIP